MINPEDEIIPDFGTSCTRDEAAALLLGWMQGPIRYKYIQVTTEGIPMAQMRYLLALAGGSLEKHFVMLREAAQIAMNDAYKSDATMEVREEREKAVSVIDESIQKAASFLMDIDDEIAKGRSSAFRIDPNATDSSGIAHYTLRSVDQWALKHYNIHIIDPSQSKIFADMNTPEPKQVEELEPKGGLSKLKSENLHTSFAFLVEAFADLGSRFKSADSPNIKAIAERIAELATKANKGQPLSGQSSEAIKDRIEQAARIRRKKLLEE